jgi:hypothetical protein
MWGNVMLSFFQFYGMQYIGPYKQVLNVKKNDYKRGI